jgi:sulfur carrier protein
VSYTIPESRPLKIVLNGEEREFPVGATVTDLIRLLALAPERVAVEVNREVVRRASWGETRLNAGDRVEIVHFVGGGALEPRVGASNATRHDARNDTRHDLRAASDL